MGMTPEGTSCRAPAVIEVKSRVGPAIASGSATGNCRTASLDDHDETVSLFLNDAGAFGRARAASALSRCPGRGCQRRYEDAGHSPLSAEPWTNAVEE